MIDTRKAHLARAKDFARKGNEVWARIFADKANEIEPIKPKEAEMIDKFLRKQGLRDLGY